MRIVEFNSKKEMDLFQDMINDISTINIRKEKDKNYPIQNVFIPEKHPVRSLWFTEIEILEKYCGEVGNTVVRKLMRYLEHCEICEVKELDKMEYAVYKGFNDANKDK